MLKNAHIDLGTLVVDLERALAEAKHDTAVGTDMTGHVLAHLHVAANPTRVEALARIDKLPLPVLHLQTDHKQTNKQMKGMGNEC